MQPFDDKIQSVIKKFYYPVWLIRRQENIKCTCINYSTNQADPSCKKCLGLGRQLIIEEIKAAHQPFRTGLSGTNMASEYALFSSYYTLDDIQAHIGDVFVDKNQVDIIQDYYEERSDHFESVYFRYLVAPKKANKEIFLNNFYQIIGR